MKAIVKLTPNVTLEIEEREEMEVLHKAIVFARPKQYCAACQKAGTRKYYTTNKDKDGNIYVNVKCECGARSKLGQYKAGGYFWHEFEVYDPNKKKEESEVK